MFIFDIYKLNFEYDLPDDMYEDFKFVFEDKNGKRRVSSVFSRHMGGAVRRLYQENNVERVIAIAEQ